MKVLSDENRLLDIEDAYSARAALICPIALAISHYGALGHAMSQDIVSHGLDLVYVKAAVIASQK